MRQLRGLAAGLLRVPLFYKVLIANTLLIFAGAVIGATVILARTNAVIADELWLILTLTAIGTALSVGINSLFLLAAFRPLRSIERTAHRVELGEGSERVPYDPLADEEISRVGRAMNAMLDALDRDREEIERSARQLEQLSAKALSAQEEERKRIARELHDQTGQAITSLALGLKAIESAPDLPTAREHAASLRELARRALDDVHRLSQELRPRTLDDLGLLPALRLAVQEWSKAFGLQVSLVHGGETRLPPACETAVYRVIQEAVTNAAKHASATNVWIRLGRSDDRVVVTITDDGRGFDVTSVMSNRDQGLGLFGMQERAMLLNGILHVDSSAGTGTRVQLALPVSSSVATARTSPLARVAS